TTTPLAVTPDGISKATLVAKVSPAAGSGIPTGTVQFKDGDQVIGSAPLTQSAGAVSATFQIEGLTNPGTHSFAAAYQGDSTFGGSISTSQGQFGTQIVAVNGASFLTGFAPDQWVTIFAMIWPPRPWSRRHSLTRRPSPASLCRWSMDRARLPPLRSISFRRTRSTCSSPRRLHSAAPRSMSRGPTVAPLRPA